jgi:hypothetical protein
VSSKGRRINRHFKQRICSVTNGFDLHCEPFDPQSVAPQNGAPVAQAQNGYTAAENLGSMFAL